MSGTLALGRPERSAVDGVARIQATVSFPGHSDCRRVWFEVPSIHGDSLATDRVPFIVGLIMPAMRAGIPLTIDEPLDPVLLRNLGDVQRVFANWFPDRLRRVSIDAPVADGASRSPDKRLGVFFSGGIDGMYALLRASVELASLGRAADGMLIPVQGFDVDLSDEASFAFIAASAGHIAADLGWTVVPVRTNLKRDLYEPDGLVSWTREGHGAALASVGHLLSRALETVSIGSTDPYVGVVPWGSTAITDHLWSSSNLEVVHVGADRSRMSKIRELTVRHPGWLARTRVCGRPTVGAVPNCGRCEKCVRTALSALAVGAYDLLAPSFRADVRADPDAALSALYSTDVTTIGEYAEIADALEARAETAAMGRRLHRQTRYLRPGPAKRALRYLDHRYLGDLIDRSHTRLVHRSRRQGTRKP